MSRWWSRGAAVCLILIALGVTRRMPVDVAAQPARPNIVLMFPDNLGWGEVGAYGSVRGELTPRLDRLAA